MIPHYRPIAIIALAAISLSGTSALGQIAPPDPTVEFSLDAAGATFPFPLIDLWRVEYGKEYPNVSLNYQSIGSGGGIKQHIENTVDFAATDTPMRASEAELAPGTLHIPESLGAVVVSYNIPTVPKSGMQLDGQTLASIFLGEITMWDDEQISAQNPGLTLPSKEIITVHRSDGSGTTFIFTDYLSTVYEQFDLDVGTGKSVPWPGGIAAAGNEGVAGIIRSTPHSIGYVELAYAHQTGMTFAHMQNGDMTAYVEPTIDSISAASSEIASALPAAQDLWRGVSMVNAPGPDSYPISSLTYLLVYDDLGEAASSLAEAGAIVHVLHWMLTDGQAHSESLLYVPIPPEISQIGIDGISSITYNGAALWGAGPLVDASGTKGGKGGCLIATAAYGSEIAPQVQALREVRDSVLMSTATGASFMGAFNDIYYTFSPQIADFQIQNPETRDIVRALVSPMIASLSIMSYAEAGSESDVLTLGAIAIALNIGMYIAAPVAAVSLVRRQLAGRGDNSC